MNLKQCPGCAATVDASKSFCPECGTPMEEELKSNSSSEFDSMMRTQNINKTAQLRMLEDFNLSGIFTKQEISETAANDTEAFVPPRPEIKFDPGKTQTIILKPENEIPAAKKPAADLNSNTKLYFVIGTGLVLIGLGFTLMIILAVLFYYFFRLRRSVFYLTDNEQNMC